MSWFKKCFPPHHFKAAERGEQDAVICERPPGAEPEAAAGDGQAAPGEGANHQGSARAGYCWATLTQLTASHGYDKRGRETEGQLLFRISCISRMSSDRCYCTLHRTNGQSSSQWNLAVRFLLFMYDHESFYTVVFLYSTDQNPVFKFTY